jgi:hypothetical protein
MYFPVAKGAGMKGVNLRRSVGVEKSQRQVNTIVEPQISFLDEGNYREPI